MTKMMLILVALVTLLACAPAKTAEDIARDERTYMAKLTSSYHDIDNCLIPVSLALSEPEISNSSWRLKCDISTSSLSAAVYTGNKLIAPSSLSYIDTPYKQALAHFSSAISLSNKGLRYYDEELIYQANAEFELAAPYYVQARDLVNEAKTARGIQ